MKTRGVLKCKSAITVLEVVILLVIVLVLAAVLFPIFARTGHPPGKMQCQNNMHECAIALQLYWQDYDNTLPSSALVSHSNAWSAQDFRVFATTKTASRKQPLSWGSAVGRYLRRKDYGDQRICPSDDVDRENNRSYVSYWWKLAIDRAWYGVGCRKPCRKEADFAYNADQIVFYERAGFHDNHPKGLGYGTRINVAYLDTHVRSVTLTNATTGNPDHPELAANGEPMYFNYDQSKVKGPNNPPPAKVPAKYLDPARYSDLLP